MKSFRTLLGGGLTIAGLLFGPGLADHSKPVIDTSMLIPSIGVAIHAWNAKDKQVTGIDK